MRRKEIEEQEDFYRICVSKQDQEDIQTLLPIRERLHNREAFDKLIYDSFIKKPLEEMVKRILNNKNPSGIYKITYIPTGEFYIGRSTTVADRWKAHLKTTYNLKGCAHSYLHTFMAEKGCWNFSFELLEECDKDSLNEREKFYIELYGATGMLNEKAGG